MKKIGLSILTIASLAYSDINISYDGTSLKAPMDYKVYAKYEIKF